MNFRLPTRSLTNIDEMTLFHLDCLNIPFVHLLTTMFRLASRPLLASSLAVIGSTVGVVAYTRNYNVVGLDATGTANWDSSRARYDDDLKVNRHKSE